jgi:hypothetical protein
MDENGKDRSSCRRQRTEKRNAGNPKLPHFQLIYEDGCPRGFLPSQLSFVTPALHDRLPSPPLGITPTLETGSCSATLGIVWDELGTDMNKWYPGHDHQRPSSPHPSLYPRRTCPRPVRKEGPSGEQSAEEATLGPLDTVQTAVQFKREATSYAPASVDVYASSPVATMTVVTAATSYPSRSRGYHYQAFMSSSAACSSSSPSTTLMNGHLIHMRSTQVAAPEWQAIDVRFPIL